MRTQYTQCIDYCSGSNSYSGFAAGVVSSFTAIDNDIWDFRYGNTPWERLTNFPLWDYMTGQGVFAPGAKFGRDPNAVSTTLADNPASWVLPGGASVKAPKFLKNALAVFKGRKGAGAANAISQTFKSIGAAGRGWKNVKFISDKLLKKQGLNAHVIKTEFLGPKNISKFDLFKHTDTGEILIFRKGGIGEPIFTGYFIH